MIHALINAIIRHQFVNFKAGHVTYFKKIIILQLIIIHTENFDTKPTKFQPKFVPVLALLSLHSF